jgi:lysophospholipase L1-like esterase
MKDPSLERRFLWHKAIVLPRLLIISDSILKYVEDLFYGSVLGIPGATINDIIDEIKEESIDVSGYEVCVIHIGTNSVRECTPVIKHTMGELATLIRSKNSNCGIVISSILIRPIDEDPPGTWKYGQGVEEFAGLRVAANSVLEELCMENDYKFLETFKATMKGSDHNRKYYTDDELHLSQKGNKKIMQYFRTKMKLSGGHHTVRTQLA